MSNHDKGKKGRKSHSLFPLGCICKDMKSVSVCVPGTTEMINKSSFRKNNNRLSSTGSLTLPSIISNPSHKGIGERENKQESLANTPSFSSLLRELNELEQSVKEWGGNNKYPSSPPSFSPSDKSKERIGAAGRLEESIVVVKESDDPLDDFKKSMLQMIVQNEIEGKDEMEELLHRFLLLNSLENHDVIIRAFAELWEEVFCEVEETA
jgi:uncharacterized protein (TIGR01568 family)